MRSSDVSEPILRMAFRSVKSDHEQKNMDQTSWPNRDLGVGCQSCLASSINWFLDSNRRDTSVGSLGDAGSRGDSGNRSFKRAARIFQEQKAEKGLSSLEELSSPVAKVIRDGSLRILPAETLVPGDVVEVEAGDHVPADARLVTTFALKMQEAALTGESTPIEKDSVAVLPDDVGIAERANVVFTGTTVVAGKGRGVVTAIGMNTELGRIAGFLITAKREPTPLQKRLAELGRALISLSQSGGCHFVLELLRGESLANLSHGGQPGGGGGARRIAGGGGHCPCPGFAAHG